MKFVAEENGKTLTKSYPDSVSSMKPTWSDQDANLGPQLWEASVGATQDKI